MIYNLLIGGSIYEEYGKQIRRSTIFFNKMKETENVFPEFNYYLNAFISSSRSVLWIMNAEYNKIEGWHKWYADKEPGELTKIMLKGIVDARNRSLKKEPLYANKYITLGDDQCYTDLMEIFKKFSGKRIDLEIKQYTECKKYSYKQSKNELVITGKLSINKTIEEFKNKSIIEVADKYVEWLEEIV